MEAAPDNNNNDNMEATLAPFLPKAELTNVRKVKTYVSCAYAPKKISDEGACIENLGGFLFTGKVTIIFLWKDILSSALVDGNPIFFSEAVCYLSQVLLNKTHMLIMMTREKKYLFLPSLISL